MRIWALGIAIWLLLLAGAFQIDRWTYENAAGPVAELIGEKVWRFERPWGGRSPKVRELLYLSKRLGHAFFIVLVSVTIVVLVPRRARQVGVLWLCVAFAALVSQGLVRPSVAKLRPDAELEPARAAALVDRHGPDAVVRRHEVFHNRGHAVFRDPFSGFARSGGLTFPSGHATLAFATFAALSAMFPRGKPWFLLLACANAVSRVLMGEHFVSDVVAGAGVGYACAALVLARPRFRAAMERART